VEVSVNLYGEARKYGKKASFALRVPAGTSVADVLAYLKAPEAEPLAIVLNGMHVAPTHPLAEEDVLSIFSMAAFGAEFPAAEGGS